MNITEVKAYLDYSEYLMVQIEILVHILFLKKKLLL